jgi:SAM-dependent methyltransferase
MVFVLNISRLLRGRFKRWGRTSDSPAKPFTLEASHLSQLMELVGEDSRPNVNALRQLANAIEPLSLSVKQMGYQLAQQMADALPLPENTSPRHVGVVSSLSTQSAIESDWVMHWCAQLKVPVVFHRKLWELAFTLQVLYDENLIRAGVRGLGFGCGSEPLPSYFAAQGMDVTITDLPHDEAAASGWVDTGQHAGSLDAAFFSNLVDRPSYDKHVQLRYVDMNAIPDDLRDYDFCWSICALEHLGSIDAGLSFIENALATLKPGGVAVHTTEFNIRPDGPTIDNWPSVAFQRKHIEGLIEKLEAQGHHIEPLDLRLGDKPLDKFVDVPPYHHDLPPEIRDWLGTPAHLKLAFDGLVVTCLGLKITKGG